MPAAAVNSRRGCCLPRMANGSSISFSSPFTLCRTWLAAGHKDGTRDISVEEGAKIVGFLPGMTSGHCDLQIKTHGATWKKVFVWDHNSKRYITPSAPALSQR